MNIYNGIIQGLEEAVAYNEGRGKFAKWCRKPTW